MDEITSELGCSAAVDSTPPSLHMRLGNGLARARCAPQNISCFGSAEANLTTEEPKTKKLLSESDLFNILECPIDDREKSQV